MPVNSKLHVDQLLSNISVKYKPQGYIADQVFPIVPVKKESDIYRVYERNFKLPETARANKGLANEADFDVSTSSYYLKKHAQKAYISDDDIDNYDLTDLRTDHTENLTDIILRRREVTVAALFTSTQWSQNLSLTAAQQFDGTTTANPIPIFDTATNMVLQQSGYEVNFGIMDRKTMYACKNNTQVLDRIKYTSSALTPTMLAALFGLPELLIANGAYDTAAAGVAASISDIWSDNAFVGYKPASPGMLAPSSGYIFQKPAPQVRRWRVEEREAEAIEVQQKYDVKVVASLSGFLIKDCRA